MGCLGRDEDWIFICLGSLRQLPVDQRIRQSRGFYGPQLKTRPDVTGWLPKGREQLSNELDGLFSARSAPLLLEMGGGQLGRGLSIL